MRGFRGALALATAIMALALPAIASADELRVPWTIDGALVGQANPNSAPPGSNDWSCEPSDRHPDPVVLVHGLLANRTVNFSTMSPFLANRGFCVYALTYGTRDSADLGLYQPGGLNRMQESARELKRFVGRVLDATGAGHVDIVGHSEGSLMPNWYVKFLGGDRVVDDYVGVTPLWDGTNAAGLATIDQIGRALGLSQGAYDALALICESCPQFLSGSGFMERMSSGGGPRVAGVDYTMIMTRNDELVVPYTSGEMDGAKNIVVQEQCPLDQSEHLSIIFDPTTATDIFNALDPKHAKPIPCTLVLPLVGAVGYSGN
jgi:triacylglycerol lipase